MDGKGFMTVFWMYSSYAPTFSSLNFAKLIAALKILRRRLCSGFAMSLSEKSCTPQQLMRRML